jgi:hypothetical protein
MKKVFEYISSVSEKIFETKKIDASIQEKKNEIENIKLQIEQLKATESDVKGEIATLLSKAEEYGMTKKSVQTTSEEYVENMIGNGILDVTTEINTASTVVVDKPRNTKRKRKESVETNDEVSTVVTESISASIPEAEVLVAEPEAVSEPPVSSSISEPEVEVTSEPEVTLETTSEPEVEIKEIVTETLPEVEVVVDSVDNSEIEEGNDEPQKKKISFDTPTPSSKVPSFLRNKSN